MAKQAPIVIAGIAFPTQGALRQHCRELLYADGIDADGETFLRDLITRHKDAEQKMGVGIKTFYVRTNEYQKRGFYIVRLDGSRTDLSFNECIKGRTPEQDAKAGFREAIKEQIFAFRDRAFADGPVACAITGDPVTMERAHIDHRPPDTFLRLVERFLAAEGLPLGAVSVNSTEDLSAVTRLADPALEARWQAFHQQHAGLQVTSAKANLVQGKGR